MPNQVLKLQLTAVKPEAKLEIKDRIFKTHTEELIIGLCGPIGTEIHLVADCLKDTLTDLYSYKCQIIKLSDLIKRHSGSLTISPQEIAYDRKRKFIEAGNKLREENGGSILAALAINEIAVTREKNKTGDEFVSHRTCYIIDSIKNKEELELFKLIYRDIFYFIGIFSSVDLRVKNLEESGLKTHEVYELIDRDSGEEMNFGQKVSDTFIDADFFRRFAKETSGILQNELPQEEGWQKNKSIFKGNTSEEHLIFTSDSHFRKKGYRGFNCKTFNKNLDMSKKAKENKSKSQLSLDLNLKAEDISTKASQDLANPKSTKIVYIDSRQEIYKRILDRNMK